MAKKQKPLVVVHVSGGVATMYARPGLQIELRVLDYDNFEAGQEMTAEDKELEAAIERGELVEYYAD